MANPPNKQPTPVHEKPREASEEKERRQTNPSESHGGIPGYGQPPEDVREKRLPDQKW